MEVSPKDVPTALVHLYRGELGRMTVYRTRLDATTNWAVGTGAAMISFALGDERVPHTVLLLALCLVLIFLWMEARRFRYYELVRMRVRLLETGFYVGTLGGEPRPGWEEALRSSLATPEPPISMVGALAARLRRNYLLLVGAVFLGWLFKLHLTPGSLLDTAAAGPLPGAAVLAGAVLVLGALIAVSRTHRLDEEE